MSSVLCVCVCVCVCVNRVLCRIERYPISYKGIICYKLYDTAACNITVDFRKLTLTITNKT
jgi:hypothetical protein